jgi:hypothetical protein
MAVVTPDGKAYLNKQGYSHSTAVQTGKTAAALRDAGYTVSEVPTTATMSDIAQGRIITPTQAEAKDYGGFDKPLTLSERVASTKGVEGMVQPSQKKIDPNKGIEQFDIPSGPKTTSGQLGKPIPKGSEAKYKIPLKEEVNTVTQYNDLYDKAVTWKNKLAKMEKIYSPDYGPLKEARSMTNRLENLVGDLYSKFAKK